MGRFFEAAFICFCQSILSRIPVGLDQLIRDDLQVIISSCRPEDLFLANAKSNPSLHCVM